jgi:hypothetical protein
MQSAACPAWSSFESVTIDWTGGYLRADQAVKTPTKPAEVFVFTSYPGVVLHAGLLNDFTHPVCGCDACDETWQSVAAEMERQVLAVAGGGYRETWWFGLSPCVTFSLDAVDGSQGMSGENRAADVPADRLAAAKNRRRGIGHAWQPWPMRTQAFWAPLVADPEFMGQATGMGNSGDTGIDDVSADRVRAVRRWGTAMAVVASILCGGGILLSGLLFFQFIDVYFTIWTPAVVEDADIRRYQMTATLCLIALGASFIAALVARHRKLAWLAGVVLVLGIGATLLFAVPQGRWTPLEPSPEPLPSNYEPCYSGSNNCGGGG